jgi:hypothetical protein
MNPPPPLNKMIITTNNHGHQQSSSVMQSGYFIPAQGSNNVDYSLMKTKSTK